MRIKFWGVRGSIASPGPDTAAVGGNTSCVEIACGPTRIVLDAGTGIRRLGDALLAQGPVDATLLLSHLHWDHIQGLPFFVPAYLPSSRLRVIGMPCGVMSLREALAHQMQAPVFPVRLDELAAQIAAQATVPGSEDDNEFVAAFAAMGVTQREAGFFRAHFAERAALEWTVLFLLRLSATALKRSTRPCSRGRDRKGARRLTT